MPMTKGSVGSLNTVVCRSVVLFEYARQREVAQVHNTSYIYIYYTICIAAAVVPGIYPHCLTNRERGTFTS